MATKTRDTMTRKIEVRRGLRWEPAYAGGKKENTIARKTLLKRISAWYAKHDNDIIGGLIRPKWLIDAEQELAQLDERAEAYRPEELAIDEGGSVVDQQDFRVREDDLTVEGTVKWVWGESAPRLQVALTVTLKGEVISSVHRWTDEGEIFRARSQWQGTGDVRETIYDMAAHLVNVAKQRTVGVDD